MADQWLYTIDGSPHAYSTDGANFFLTAGGYWAWKSDTWLYSANTGRPLGWFVENFFFDESSGRASHYLA